MPRSPAIVRSLSCDAVIATATQRSAVTNGKRMLVGVDGNSALGRRYRDLVLLLTAELGGDLSEAERLQVRNAATFQLHAEQTAAALVRGEAVDPEVLTRATNAAQRALTALRKRAMVKRPAAPSLADYLAAKREAAE